MRIGTPYKRYNFEASYDTVVIGSGVGGLTTAALLAKHARERVLVLERHYTAGGLTHSFERPGFEWDVGLHYVGEAEDADARTRRLFDHLTDGQLQWADMGDVYDTIVIEGRRYDLVKGKEAFRQKMKGYFPSEARAVDRYLDAVEGAVRYAELFFAEKVLPHLLSSLVGGLLRWPALRSMRRTTAEVLAGLTESPELRAVLGGQWGDYGLPPGQSSFFMHAMTVNHYLAGAAYPVGGSSRIAETISPGIESRGGAVLLRAEVSQILIEDGRAVGVRMADGREIRAGKVVSDAGLAVTYGQLLPEATRERYRLAPQLGGVGPSGPHLCLYVGLDRTASQLGLEKANQWIYPGPDHDANMAAFVRDPDAPLPLAYLSFSSAKNPEFERKYPGRATVEVLCPAVYEWFERWQPRAWGRRGDSYDAFKQHFSERLMAVLERECPSIVGHVRHAELSTPLSTRHFAGHPRGEMIGLAHNPARFEARWLKPRTPIRDLYLTGSDVCLAGVTGAVAGGTLAATVIMGRNMVSVALRGASTPRQLPPPNRAPAQVP